MRQKKKRVKVFDVEGVKSFAENFKRIRKSKGFTQESLSEKSGLELSQIARIETAKSNATLSTILTLSRAMKIKPSELFDFNL